MEGVKSLPSYCVTCAFNRQRSNELASGVREAHMPLHKNLFRLLEPPLRKNGLGIRGFDLLAVTIAIDIEQRVVPLVGRTADRVGDYDHPVAAINGAQHSGRHADIGLRAGDDQSVNLPLVEVRGELRLAKAE